MTPLHIAVLHGQTNTVRYLLTKYPFCVNAINHTGQTALHYAFASQAYEIMVRLLRKAGADDFIEDKFGHTPLFYQNNSNQLDFKMMIKDNDQMDELITGQMSGPLLQDLEENILDWIHTGNLRKLDDLVLIGYADLLSGRTHEVGDPDIRHFLNELPKYQSKIDGIHKAIEAANLRTIKVLVDRKKMAFCRDARHLTPLHKAIVLGQIGIAKFLIKNYPQVTNAMDENKRTPLHYAAALPDGGFVYKKMRSVGADSKIFDCNGRQPSYYLRNPGQINFKAISTEREIILDEIIRNHVTSSYLESNIRQWLNDGNVGKLEQLVLSGCGDLLSGRVTNNLNSKAFLDHLNIYLDEIDEIHKAIKKGDLRCVKELISSKKLALARNRLGHTPLHTAIIYEQTEIIRHIASNFPSVINSSDYNKRTPMHYAAATHDGGHYIKILIKAGADSNALDNEGHTPHYYGLNSVINLELLRKTDDKDSDVAVAENFVFEQTMPRIDSALSSDSGSSNISISTRGQEERDLYKFENDISQLVPGSSTSSNGIYLARTVAPVLTKALTEVLLQRPIDPILFIANWLTNYSENNPPL
uniref:ANK_REP_REGION domain-containing protein n=1 Tax=Elaeophora elaphi TaxID=1147741 RepID=A0A0R3RJ35_9BILA